jgi:hypothetical protein
MAIVSQVIYNIVARACRTYREDENYVYFGGKPLDSSEEKLFTLQGNNKLTLDIWLEWIVLVENRM